MTTERQWLNGNAQAMAEWLRTTAADRKVRLFFCAAARRHWATLPFVARRAVEAAERFADDPTTYPVLQAAARALAISFATGEEDEYECEEDFRPDVTVGEYAAENGSRNDARSAVPPALDGSVLDLAREIFGNPFRLPTIEPAWLKANDHAVLRLARMVYQEQAWERLPVLADALEDAGCADEALLEHLRSPGPHVRGCWVIDRLTGDRPFATDDPGAPPPELPVVLFPRRAWLVTFTDRWTPETDPLGDADRQHVLPLLAPDSKKVVLAAEWKPEGLKRSRLVKKIDEVWHFTQTEEGVEWPDRMRCRCEEGPAGVTLFWDDQDAALKDLAKVCEVVKVVMGLRRSGPLPGRALAEKILAGDAAQLPLLARVLEQSGSPRAEAVCALLKREAKVAERDRRSGHVEVKSDEERTQAQTKIAERACPGCKKKGVEQVRRVNKAGPNCGRLFASCGGCNHFEWLSGPDPANAAKQPATPAADEALEALRAGAGNCPACGKPRSANRVKKEGPNKGRLFYSCSDRGCDHFEWASPAAKAAGPAEAGSDAELAQMRQEYGTCACGQGRGVHRVRKEGENKGRLFAKCDACGVFEWL